MKAEDFYFFSPQAKPATLSSGLDVTMSSAFTPGARLHIGVAI